MFIKLNLTSGCNRKLGYIKLTIRRELMSKQQMELTEFLKTFLPQQAEHEEIAKNILKDASKFFPNSPFITVEFVGGPSQS